jgi:hypothetical protein
LKGTGSDSKGIDQLTAAEVSDGLVVVKHRASEKLVRYYSFHFISRSDFFLDAGKFSASRHVQIQDTRQG